MNCCQCQGIEELFDAPLVEKELRHYRARGAAKTTRLLVDALKVQGVQGLSLLDIGGGVGAVQHGLIAAGAARAVDVDASRAYLQAAQEEAARRGMAEQVSFQHGNFVDLASQVAPADIVTLDRVVCCYPDMQNLVSESAARARKLYGLVYPRDAWWVRLGVKLLNLVFRWQRNPFRTFVHPSSAVDGLVRRHGFQPVFYRRTPIWQVVVYAR